MRITNYSGQICFLLNIFFRTDTCTSFGYIEILLILIPFYSPTPLQVGSIYTGYMDKLDTFDIAPIVLQ